MASNYVFLLILTILAYLGSLWVYRKLKSQLLHPLITSTLAIIIFLMVFDVDYGRFKLATELIDMLLGPSVVALGWLLAKYVKHLRANAISILTSITIGSLVGILSVVGIMRLFGTSAAMEASIVPKSVTTPIAMQIAEQSGGISSLTAVVVILVGILGSIIAPPILKAMGISSPIARGLALGAAAHGVGTARALEMGALEGAISGLAIGLMGIITAILVPLVKLILG